MDRVLRLKPHLRAEVLAPRRVFLVGERARFLLEGEAYARVVPLLDGHRTGADVVAALEGQLSAPEVLYALARLEERGHVEEALEHFDASVAGFWEALGIDAAVAAERLLERPVSVRAVAGEDREALEEALRDAGLLVEADEDPEALETLSDAGRRVPRGGEREAQEPLSNASLLLKRDEMREALEGALRDAGLRVETDEDREALEELLDDAGLRVTSGGDREALEENREDGVPRVDTGGVVPLRVLLVDDYLSPGALALAREARAAGASFLAVKVAGTACHVGPVLAPGDGACWTCLTERLLLHRPIEKYLARREGRAAVPLPPRTGLPSAERSGMAFAAVHVARWVAAPDSARDSRLWTLDFATGALASHAVTRRPQCAECGDPAWMARRAEAPLVLTSRPKRFTEDGGHRVLTPEETWERHRHLVSPVTGVVSDLRAIPGDAALGHIQSALFPICPWTEEPSAEDFHRVASGKGRTEAQARAGALCEALERHSAVFQGDEPRVHAPFSSLGPSAVHPDALQHFSAAQLRSRKDAPQRDARTAVPRTYADEPLDWSPAWSLTHGTRRYVPTAFAYLATPPQAGGPFCLFTSNGNAAGNCLEEAVLQGFLELVERDAVALWWYNRLRRPRVDLASFDAPWFTSVEAHYRTLGLRLWVLDLTHDLGLPVFAALAWSPERGRAWAGCGCHFDARLAVQRALTEVAQCYDPRDTSPSPWDASAHPDVSWLFPDDAAAPRVRADFPRVWHDDLKDDVAACVERASRAGLEVLVVDQSRPDVGVSAVKVIVPGLRHFWPRLGPGRLYDVPVRLGWRATPLTEAQLNPVPFYF